MRKTALAAILIVALLTGASGYPVSAASTTKQSTKQKHTASQAAAKKPQAPPPVMVTVASGDTLSSIATENQTTYVRIYNANEQVTDPNVIDVGWELRIPAADEQLTDRGLPTAKVTTGITTTTRATTASYVALPNDDAKAFIYSHESGNNPNATSSNGCYGLGQDCNGVVRNLCGADYNCQDQYFTGYAMRRYGSWANAEAFWLNHHWW